MAQGAAPQPPTAAPPDPSWKKWLAEHWLLPVLAALTVLAVAAVATIAHRHWADHHGDPLSVVVTSDQDKIQMGGHPVHGQYVIPRLPSEMTRPPASASGKSCLITNAYAAAQGGVVADTQLVDVVFTAERSGSTTVNNFSVEQQASAQNQPLAGSLPACGRGGPPATVAVLKVDLYKDPQRTKAQLFYPGHKKHDFDFPLQKGEQAEFLVMAKAHGCDCSWSLTLGGSADGTSFSQDVNNNGQPFRVTSTQYAKDVYAQDGRWKRAATTPAYSIPPPPAGISLPSRTACQLVTGSEWKRITGLNAQESTNPLNGKWTSAERLPDRPPQAASNCSYQLGSPSGGVLATLQLVVATTDADAQMVARQYQGSDQSSPWKEVSKDVTVNGNGLAVVRRGHAAVILSILNGSASSNWSRAAANLVARNLEDR